MFGSGDYQGWIEKPFHLHAGDGFARIYVALHPFAHLLGIEPRSATAFDFQDCRPDSPVYFRVRNRQTGPNAEVDDICTILKLFGTGQSWASVADGAGLASFAKVYQAINSQYNRLTDEYADSESAIRLMQHLKANRLIFPDEDHMSVFHEIAIGNMYKELGVNTVVVGDQHDKTGKLPVERLLALDRSIEDVADMPLVGFSHDPDKKMLTVSDYNNQYSLICLSPDAAKIVDPSAELEGFWADAKTDVEWWTKS